jgi:hydrogenase nickel incorporation protein HypA/HybF
MHEMSLVEGIVALIEDERQHQMFARVCRVHIHLGALGHVEPDALRFCFDALTRGTVADGAALSIVTIAGQGACSACKQTVALTERYDECPLCGHPQVKLIAGDELRLAELEVE